MIDKEKSLAYRFPELAKEWHPVKNGDLTPNDVTVGSNKNVWWIGKCGHEWDSVVKERVRGYGCPVCAGKRVYKGINDLESNFPEIVVEWNYERNHPLLPNEITARSAKKVWWICSNGHQYKSSVYNRTRGRGCPYCSNKLVTVGKNDLKSQNPSLAKEYSLINKVSADSVFVNSHTKVWWTCSQCNHEWKATVDSRNRGNGCPACAQRTQSSFPEQAVFYYVKQTCSDAISRCTSILDSRLELDIYIPSLKIGIEYDGKYWHTGQKTSRREKDKFSICTQKGIFLIRITDETALNPENCNHSISASKGIDNAIKELGNFMPIPVDINCDRDRLKITEEYIRSKKENSLAIKRPSIASEWNYKKNGKLTPDMFSEFSMIKVWWKCKNGHEWESTIAHRTSMGSNCPYCSSRKVLTGFNDVTTTHPELLQEWDFQKNIYLPTELTAGSNKKVWWKCEKGHSWETTIGERKHGSSCPVCSGHTIQMGYNDLATTHPIIASEWHPEKNFPLTPNKVSFGSNKTVWWKCNNGHEWKSMILSRSKGAGCPYCSGRRPITGENDLATTHPALLKEWDYKQNNSISPSQVTHGSGKKVWWICSTCGHHWNAAIKDRTSGHGCPMCARKRRNNGTV